MWVDVKTTLHRVEKPGPLPVCFCQEYWHRLQGVLDLGLREGKEMEEESTCTSQSHAAILLKAELVKGGHPDGNKLASGAICLHNSLSLQYLLFLQQG